MIEKVSRNRKLAITASEKILVTLHHEYHLKFTADVYLDTSQTALTLSCRSDNSMLRNTARHFQIGAELTQAATIDFNRAFSPAVNGDDNN